MARIAVSICMKYFALLGVIKRYLLFQLSQESKQCFNKFAKWDLQWQVTERRESAAVELPYMH